MGTGASPRVREVLPEDAWEILKTSETSVLIDVRTRAEWAFVGTPDLSPLGRETMFVEWQSWPDMSRNPQFVDDLLGELGGVIPSQLLFICRSGARSLRAAKAVDEALRATGHDAACINVAEGFEGDLDSRRHRGGLTGWKARGLAWQQS